MDYFTLLKGELIKFADIPLRLFAKKDQRTILSVLEKIFLELKRDLLRDDLWNTPSGKAVGKILDSLDTENFKNDELNFCENLIFLFEVMTDTATEDVNEILQLLYKIRGREEVFAESEAIAFEGRNEMTAEEVFLHDKEIIANDMQFYALDYFLYALKFFQENPTLVNEFFFRGYKKLPPLIDDAMSGDMLEKIVYRLFDVKIREKMVAEYYHYKFVFLQFVGKDNLSESDRKKVYFYLMRYSLSLLKISQKMQTEVITKGMYFPYGKNTLIRQLINSLSNG